MVTPTRNYIIFLAKGVRCFNTGNASGSYRFFGSNVTWCNNTGVLGLAAFIIALFLLSLGLSSIYLLITMKSSDWQIPTVIANFINLPLMFSSTALFPKENFPPWMQIISDFNPVSYSSTFGREIIISGNNSIHTIPWIYFIYLLIFALVMLIIGMFVATKTLKIE